MSSSISNVAPKEQRPEGLIPFVKQYLVPPVAASVAIIPVFHGLVVKSAQQLEQEIPQFDFKKGLKSAPTVGIVVGAQLGAQHIVEKIFIKFSGKDRQQDPSGAQIAASSMIIGGISIPILAVLNGQTMGFTVVESLRNLTAKQGAAIMIRETSFLFSLRISDKVANLMNRWFGKRKSVEYGCAFVSGGVGSLSGHIFDVWLTRLQKNLTIEKASQLRRGAPVRAFTLSLFAVSYKAAKEFFNSCVDKVAGG